MGQGHYALWLRYKEDAGWHTTDDNTGVRTYPTVEDAEQASNDLIREQPLLIETTIVQLIAMSTVILYCIRRFP